MHVPSQQQDPITHSHNKIHIPEHKPPAQFGQMLQKEGWELQTSGSLNFFVHWNLIIIPITITVNSHYHKSSRIICSMRSTWRYHNVTKAFSTSKIIKAHLLVAGVGISTDLTNVLPRHSHILPIFIHIYLSLTQFTLVQCSRKTAGFIISKLHSN